MGNVAIVRPGGVQWMRTGSGVEHAEGGGNPPGVEKHGFQLWINAAAADKMKDPDYGTVQPEDVPETRSASGGLCRFLAGPRAAAFQDRQDFSIVDVELPNAKATFALSVPTGFSHIIVYPYQGLGKVSGEVIRPQHAAVMRPMDDDSAAGVGNVVIGADGNMEVVASVDNVDNGTIVEFESLEDTGAAFLVFMGQPMDEPVSWRGPIVMSTARQVSTAYRELRNGGFLKKRVNFDYQAQKPTKGPPLTLL
jgi:redox-sensitive bicupin YhaK (pirin superfamily)